MCAIQRCKCAAGKSVKEYARFLVRTVLGKVRSDELCFVRYALLSFTIVTIFRASAVMPHARRGSVALPLT